MLGNRWYSLKGKLKEPLDNKWWYILGIGLDRNKLETAYTNKFDFEYYYIEEPNI
jgi:hypothetical protein